MCVYDIPVRTILLVDARKNNLILTCYNWYEYAVVKSTYPKYLCEISIAHNYSTYAYLSEYVSMWERTCIRSCGLCVCVCMCVCVCVCVCVWEREREREREREIDYVFLANVNIIFPKSIFTALNKNVISMKL